MLEGIAKARAAKAAKPDAVKKKSVCGRCGVPGHNAKTCGRAAEVAESLASETKEWEAKQAEKKQKDIETRVRRMVEGGCGYEEIATAFPKIPNKELEELIAYAQHPG